MMSKEERWVWFGFIFVSAVIFAFGAWKDIQAAPVEVRDLQKRVAALESAMDEVLTLVMEKAAERIEEKHEQEEGAE